MKPDSMPMRFERWGPAIERMSPLYAGLARRIADHPEIANLLLVNPHPEQRLPILLFAAVHNEVLRDPTIELAQWYESVTPSPRIDDPFPAFADACRQHTETIEETIATHTTQTNEVGRGAFLVPALAFVGRDLDGGISLIDIGTSAGLNLRLDKYRITYEPGGAFGPADSVVQLTCHTNDGFTAPNRIPAVVGRLGVDGNPLDVTNRDDARWLSACVWPDQPERFARLRHAIEIATTTPAELIAGDAVEDLPVVVDAARTQGHPVVINSWVLSYLSPQQRRAYLDRMRALGASGDLSWVWAESPTETPELEWPDDLELPSATHLMATTWRDGRELTEHLAVCHPHGARLSWVAA